MADVYQNYEELRATEPAGESYRIEAAKNSERLIFVAPHAGGIEVATSELTKQLSDSTNESYYLFEGLLSSGNGRLHVTSTNFDEPSCLGLMSTHPDALSLHGYADSAVKNTIVGGLNTELRNLVVEKLQSFGFSAEVASDRFTATDPRTIVNRCTSGKGVQLELSTLQRKSFFENGDWSKGNRENTTSEFFQYVQAVKEAIDVYYGSM